MDSEHDALIIRVENQGVELWGIRSQDIDLVDPPVYEFVESTELSAPSVTAFACQALLYEANFVKKFNAGNWAEEYVASGELGKLFTKCDLPNRFWCATPLKLYEGNDLIIQTHHEDWVYVTAKDREAFEQLPQKLREWLEIYEE